MMLCVSRKSVNTLCSVVLIIIKKKKESFKNGFDLLSVLDKQNKCIQHAALRQGYSTFYDMFDTRRDKNASSSN